MKRNSFWFGIAKGFAQGSVIGCAIGATARVVVYTFQHPDAGTGRIFLETWPSTLFGIVGAAFGLLILHDLEREEYKG